MSRELESQLAYFKRLRNFEHNDKQIFQNLYELLIFGHKIIGILGIGLFLRLSLAAIHVININDNNGKPNSRWNNLKSTVDILLSLEVLNVVFTTLYVITASILCDQIVKANQLAWSIARDDATLVTLNAELDRLSTYGSGVDTKYIKISLSMPHIKVQDHYSISELANYCNASKVQRHLKIINLASKNAHHFWKLYSIFYAFEHRGKGNANLPADMIINLAEILGIDNILLVPEATSDAETQYIVRARAKYQPIIDNPVLLTSAYTRYKKHYEKEVTTIKNLRSSTTTPLIFDIENQAEEHADEQSSLLGNTRHAYSGKPTSKIKTF